MDSSGYGTKAPRYISTAHSSGSYITLTKCSLWYCDAANRMNGKWFWFLT